MRSCGGGEDLLSALPDDVLVLILVLLGTAAACRTSVLSRRWRWVWALLPDLRFPADADPRLVASALAAHDAAITYLDVRTVDAAPESIEACLSVAAARLSGRVIFKNRVSEGNPGGGGEEGGAFELPCLENATVVILDLGFLGFAVPPAGIFAQLTVLVLYHVRFPSELADAFSSPRFPCLKKLTISYARGLASLTIHSASLIQILLTRLYGLQKLTVVAPELLELELGSNSMLSWHCHSSGCQHFSPSGGGAHVE